MQKIVTHLWYDKEALEAARFYADLFHGSLMGNVIRLYDTPSGISELVAIDLTGQKFMLLSGGPFFKFNPSISIRVDFNDPDQVIAVWNKLSVGGNALMPLDSYPFSAKYGWIADRYGLSWQIMYVSGGTAAFQFTPTLMFSEQHRGQAKEAINYYSHVFPNAHIGPISFYGPGEPPAIPGTIKLAAFSLAGQNFAAMDSAYPHGFAFNEAISFMVNCDTQEEIDYYWEKLSFVPEAEQCGWVKDQFGLSWQIVPTIMEKMMHTTDLDQLCRFTQAFLKMKKLDIEQLRQAYAGL